MLGVRQRDLLERAAEPLDQRQRALEDLGDPGLDALGVVGEVAGDAEPQPVERLERRQLDPALDPDRGRVVAVAALERAQQQRRVGDRRGSAARTGRARRRRRPSRSARSRRRSASARRSRRATPAGGSSRRCRCRSPTARAGRRPPPPSRPRSRPAPARGPTGCAPARSPSSRSRSPSRTRPCSSCRAAARRRRRAGARRSPCTAAGSPRGSASRRWSRSPRCRTGP